MALGGFYLLLAAILIWRAGPISVRWAKSYLALAATFVTLAILHLHYADHRGDLGAGRRRAGVGGAAPEPAHHVLLGGVAQIAAGVWLIAYLVNGGIFEETARVASTLGVSGFLVALAGFVTAWLFLDQGRRQDRLISPGDLRILEVLTSLWSMAWWLGAAST